MSVSKNESALPEKATLNFIETAIRDGRIAKKWAESTKRKVSEHMNACLIDFKLIDRNKNILPFFINDYTVNYWMHKLHFKGLGDEAILASDEWKLFGVGHQELIAIAQRLSFPGHFLFQHSGELAKIGWKYQSMSDFINGTA